MFGQLEVQLQTHADLLAVAERERVGRRFLQERKAARAAAKAARRNDRPHRLTRPSGATTRPAVPTPA
jgi:hypothetical protein